MTCHTTRPSQRLPHGTNSCQIITLQPQSSPRSAPNCETTRLWVLRAESHSLYTTCRQRHGTPDRSDSVSVSLSPLPCRGHRRLGIPHCRLLPGLHLCTSRCSRSAHASLHSTSCPSAIGGPKIAMIRWCRFGRVIVSVSRRRCCQGASSLAFCACAWLYGVRTGLFAQSDRRLRRSQRDCACASRL